MAVKNQWTFFLFHAFWGGTSEKNTLYDVVHLIFDRQRLEADLTEDNSDDKFTQLCQCSGGIDDSDNL